MLAVLTPLLSLFGIELAAITDSAKRHAILWGIIGAFAVICLAFLLVALNEALAGVFGPIVAPLVIAAAAALGAVIALAVASMQDAAAARRTAERKRVTESSALMTSAVAAAIPVILRSPLLREFGLPAGAAIASALLLRKGGPLDQGKEP